MLRTGGRFFIIFPVERLTDLFCRMRADRIEPKRMRTVHSYPEDPARRILVEGVAGGQPGTSMDSPLVIYHKDGMYSDEVQQLLS
jgi:tRNA1Val (adenine37-N6)-methyltransferase